MGGILIEGDTQMSTLPGLLQDSQVLVGPSRTSQDLKIRWPMSGRHSPTTPSGV
jgi:hypothetical protein